MGPAKAGIQELADAKSLGELIARQGWVVLTGGRASGVMDAASEGAKSVPGSLTIGVLPDSKAQVSRYVDVAIVTDLGQARNNVNVMSSDVIVACGLGGTGTVSEVALALKAKKTVILLGANKAGVGLFKNLAPHLVHAVTSPEEAVEADRRSPLAGCSCYPKRATGMSSATGATRKPYFRVSRLFRAILPVSLRYLRCAAHEVLLCPNGSYLASTQSRSTVSDSLTNISEQSSPPLVGKPTVPKRPLCAHHATVRHAA